MHISGMKLADWLTKNGRTASWLAEQVGRDRSFITKVKNSEALPSIVVAAEIQRVTDGEVTAVDYLPERAVQMDSGACQVSAA